MPTVQITITGSNTSTGELTFAEENGTRNSDKHTDIFRSQQHDTIVWHVNPGSGVNTITAITMKPPTLPIHRNIFMPNGPSRIGNSANFRGSVNPAIVTGSEFVYNIEWRGTDGNNHIFDPVICVNS
jgi:hypothetical protein